MPGMAGAELSDLRCPHPRGHTLITPGASHRPEDLGLNPDGVSRPWSKGTRRPATRSHGRHTVYRRAHHAGFWACLASFRLACTSCCSPCIRISILSTLASSGLARLDAGASGLLRSEGASSGRFRSHDTREKFYASTLLGVVRCSALLSAQTSLTLARSSGSWRSWGWAMVGIVSFTAPRRPISFRDGISVKSSSSWRLVRARRQPGVRGWPVSCRLLPDVSSRLYLTMA